MLREFIAHTHEPIHEARLTEMSVDCGVSLQEVKLLGIVGASLILVILCWFDRLLTRDLSDFRG